MVVDGDYWARCWSLERRLTWLNMLARIICSRIETSDVGFVEIYDPVRGIGMELWVLPWM